MNNNNRVVRNNQGRVIRVLETPPGSPQRVARRLNFNAVANTQNSFFNEIKTALRRIYGQNFTNDVVRRLTSEDVVIYLGRRLTPQELEWLGTTRRGTANNLTKKSNINELMKKFQVSPLKRPRENETTYYDDTFTIRSPEKVENKVFLLTELGANGKVTKVYNRSALNRLNKKVGPFTKIPFKEYHIKNYVTKNRVERDFKNYRNLGLNTKNIVEAYAQRQLRPLGRADAEKVKKLTRILQSNRRLSRNVKNLIGKKVGLLTVYPRFYRNLGLSKTAIERSVAQLPENLRNIF